MPASHSTMIVFQGLVLGLLVSPGFSDKGKVPRGFEFFEPVRPPRALQVMAHRGAMRQAPENTARALELSIADTCRMGRGRRPAHQGRPARALPRRSARRQDRRHGPGTRPNTGRAAGPRCRHRSSPHDSPARASSRWPKGSSWRGAGSTSISIARMIDPAKLARDVIAAGMEHQVVIYDTPAGAQGDSRGRDPGTRPDDQVAPPIWHHALGRRGTTRRGRDRRRRRHARGLPRVQESRDQGRRPKRSARTTGPKSGTAWRPPEWIGFRPISPRR